jgi:hypothetical protein
MNPRVVLLVVLLGVAYFAAESTPLGFWVYENALAIVGVAALAVVVLDWRRPSRARRIAERGDQEGEPVDDQGEPYRSDDHDSRKRPEKRGPR